LPQEWQAAASAGSAVVSQRGAEATVGLEGDGQ